MAKGADERFDGIDYLLRRFSRIYVVVIPAPILTWIVDSLGLAVLQGSPFYHPVATPIAYLSRIDPDSLTLANFSETRRCFIQS